MPFQLCSTGRTYRSSAARSASAVSKRTSVAAIMTSAARPDDEARKKISAVQERLTGEYGYDEHSAKEALSYVTTLLAQE